MSVAHGARAKPELLLGSDAELENDSWIEWVHGAIK
jgi:hypothetical protein